MKHYRGPSGWISATVKAPKPGTLAWKINTAATNLHVRVFQCTSGRVGGGSMGRHCSSCTTPARSPERDGRPR